MKIVERMPMAEYQAAPCLSAGVLTTLIEQCPAAAKFGSWLNPNRPALKSAEADTGSLAHAILLERSEECVALINPDDHPAATNGEIPRGWTNPSIRNARDAARLAGKIPMLPAAMPDIRAMVARAESYIVEASTFEPAFGHAFKDGDSELSIFFEWEGLPCKIRPDRLSADRKLLVNYKTTSTSVEPNAWGRKQVLGMGYDIAGAFYREGCRRAFGVVPEHLWLAQETSPPYLCSLVGLDPAAWASAQAEMEAGVATWRKCVERFYWPAYPERVCYLETPGYVTARREERQALSFGERVELAGQA